MHPMVLLGDEAQVEPRFDWFGHSTNLDSREVHSLCRMYHGLRNYFVRTQWYFLGDEAQMEARFGPFGDSGNLVTR
jgi:hypothetical protein